jgi:hypothetical protein
MPRKKDLLTSATAALLAFGVGSFVWVYTIRLDHTTGVSFTLWPVFGLAVVVFAATWFISTRS